MERYGVLFGTNGGESTAPTNRLRYAELDTHRLYEWLVEHPSLAWRKDNVTCLSRVTDAPGQEPVVPPPVAKRRSSLTRHQEPQVTGPVATVEAVQSALSRVLLQQAQERDFVLVYFSGHAFEQDDQLYLVLANSNTAALGTCLRASDVIDSFVMSSAARCVVTVFNCCFSGAAAVPAAERGGWMHHLGRRRRATRSNLTRAIVASARGDQVAFEERDGDIQGSLFTYHFMRGCDGGSEGGSVDGDGVVTLDTLVKYIGDRLGSFQVPRKWVLSDAAIAIQSRLEWRIARGNPSYRTPDLIMFPESERTNSMPHISSVWELPSQHELVAFDFAADGSIAALGYRDLPVALRGGRDGQAVDGPTPPGLASQVVALPGGVTIAPDVQHLAIRSGQPSSPGNALLRVLDLVPERVGQAHTLKVDSGAADQFMITPQTKLLISCNSQGAVQFWSASTGQLLGQSDALVSNASVSVHLGQIAHLCSTPDGRRLLACSRSGTCAIWDIGGLENAVSAKAQSLAPAVPEPRLLQLPDPGVAALKGAFSPDGKLCAVGGSNGTIVIWETATGKTVRSIGAHTMFVDQLVFSPDVQSVTLVSAGGDGVVSVMTEGSWTSHSLVEVGSRILSLGYSPIRSRPLLLAATFDGRVLAVHPTRGDVLEISHGPTRRNGLFRAVTVPVASNSASSYVAIASTHHVEVWKLEWQAGEKDGPWLAS